MRMGAGPDAETWLQATVYGARFPENELFWTAQEQQGIHLAAVARKVEVKHCLPGGQTQCNSDLRSLVCSCSWDHRTNGLNVCSIEVSA